MIRKLILAAAAVAAFGTLSLTATAPASAHGWHGHHFHGHFGYRHFGVYGVGYYDPCLRTRWVVNRYGELVRRTVNVCL